MKYRRWAVLVLQASIIALSLYLAFAIRFDFRIPAASLNTLRHILLPVVLVKLLTFLLFGLHRGWWRYASLSDLLPLLKANALASLLLIAYAALFYRMETIPRSVPLLDGLLCFLFMGAALFTRRIASEYFHPLFLGADLGPSKRILILGAGSAGDSIAREIRQNRDKLRIEVVGFLDDDPSKEGVEIQGYPVLGGRDKLAALCRSEEIAEVIIAIPSASGSTMRQIMQDCQRGEVKCRTLPGISDLIDGKVSIQQVKDVDLEDLLGRETIVLDIEEIRDYLKGKCILVTGAGGSIGSEICRQVARFEPSEIVLYDSAETPVFHIHNELTERFPGLAVNPVIGDIRNVERVRRIFSRHRPAVVFHAAAYKHVPLMEANPAEAVSTNVNGTRILADTAHELGVAHFVMISTDKAVNPSSVMGASKRLAEIYVQSLAAESATHFVTVRFGNVLGSNGSVVPIFREQIAKGGPVTVTHPEITRFFMTIPEAVQLVLQAGSMGKGGEIFLLDMGEPVKILSLAEEMIRLSGFEPYEDIDIVFTGLRPGEKLFEELLLAGENVKPTRHASIHVAKAERHVRERVIAQIEQLCDPQLGLDRSGLIAKLKESVPGYPPDGISIF